MPSLTVNSGDFARAVNAAKNMILSRTTMPLLQCVAITAEGGKMRVAATDLNSGVATSIHCAGSGMWALSYDRLSAFVAAMPKGKDVAMSGETMVTMRCGSVTARIPSLDVSDFPNLHVNRPANMDLPTFNDGRFVTALSRMAVLCDDGTGRQMFMRGVHIGIDGARGKLSAITSYKAGWFDFETEALASVNAIIPASCVPSVASLFESTPLTIAQSGGLVWFAGGGCEYVTKAIDATIPDMDWPKPFHEGAFTVDVESMSSALGAVSRVSDKENAIIIRVSPSGSFLAASSGEGGMMCVPFDCEAQGEWVATASSHVIKAMLVATGKGTIKMALCPGSGIATAPHIHAIADNYLGIAMLMRGNADAIDAAIAAFDAGHVAPEAIAA